MKIAHAGESIQGRRGENQDRIWGKVFRRPSGCLRALCALADGMGGIHGGRRAAELAIAEVKDALKEPPEADDEMAVWMKSLVKRCQTRIVDEGESDESLRGMGTTLVLVTVGGEEVFVAWVGDSRCYRVGAEIAAQITHDHSVLQEALDKGLKTLDELRQSAEYIALSSTLVRGLGGDSEYKPDVARFPIVEGEICLLCSDGLTGSLIEPIVGPDTLQQQLTGNRQLSSALKNLVSLAFHAGSSDNISVAALEIGEFPRSEPWVKKEPKVT